MTFESPWSFGTRVNVDGHKDLCGVVTGFCWKDQDGHTVEVSWLHNGTARCTAFEPKDDAGAIRDGRQEALL